MLQYFATRFTAPPHTPMPQYPTDFHFCRIFLGDQLSVSLARHVHYVCAMLGLKPGTKVLNVGSGTGDVAMELVRYADVSVVGVESSYTKVQHANSRVSEARLSNKISFVHAHLDELTQRLSRESYDVIIALESLKSAHSFDAVYRDLVTLLKPGGKIGVVDWCWTTSFNPASIDHRRLAAIIESSSYLPAREPEGRSIRAACSAISGAGMVVLHVEDLAERMDKIPWYAPLENAVADSRAPWSGSADDLFPAFGGISRNSAVVIVQAAKWRLFTPLAFFVAQKAC